MNDVLPLDKGAALEKMIRRSWRVGVTNFALGITDTRDWHVETRGEAMDLALALFEGVYPECRRIGYTHGFTLVKEIRRAAAESDEIAGVPA